MQTFKKGKLTLAIAATFFAGAILSGCDSGKLPSAATTTNKNVDAPSAVNPVGSIQGVLTDSTTGEPIVGAVIDIGVTKATTNSVGVFLLSNVPATASLSINSMADVTGNYQAVIDLRAVTSPVDMTNSSATVRYPETMLAPAWAVTFTSLEDAENGTGTGGGVFDTPVTKLVSSQAVTVGKLSTSLTGEIRIKSDNALVTEVYTVQLWNGGTLLQETMTTIDTTDATAVAKFSFGKVAASTAQTITVFNADNSLRGTVAYTSPGDNQAGSLISSGSTIPVLVVGTDAATPYIYKVAIDDGTNSFENGTDIGVATVANIKFSFSEAMKADGYSEGVIPTSGTELYDDIYVNYAGAKAGDVAHSISWNTAMTELTVAIPSLSTSSLYDVHLLSGNSLMDTNGVGLNEVISAGYTNTTDTLDGTRGATTYYEIIVNFSTSGGATIASGPTVTILNDNDINIGVAPSLDWTWQTGATEYNVYRTTKTAGVITEAMIDQTTVTTSEYTPGAPAYISGELPVTYDYVVKAVNSDGTESAGSTAVTVNDVVGPTVTTALCNGGGAGLDVVQVTFSEDVAEGDAETVANYTVVDGTLTVLSVAASTNTADVTLSGNCVGGTGTIAVAVGVTDINSNPLGKTATVSSAGYPATVY